MCDERPEVIKEMKDLWTGIYVDKSGTILSQNEVTLGECRNRCPLCVDCNYRCSKCVVTDVFVGRWMFRNMAREQFPCMVLIRRIRKSRRPQGLLHSYLSQIETHIKRKRTQVVEEDGLLTH